MLNPVIKMFYQSYSGSFIKFVFMICDTNSNMLDNIMSKQEKLLFFNIYNLKSTLW